MSTAVPMRDPIDPKDIPMGGWGPMKDWPTEYRRLAARNGWRNRKDARLQAWKRFNALLATADPRLVRLYHCDMAAEALAVYAEHFPGDPRPATALWVARRYANGQATERERMGACTMLVAVMRTFYGTSSYRDSAPPRHPAYRALQVIGWALFRNPRRGLRYSMSWMSDALEERVRDGGLAARLKAAE